MAATIEKKCDCCGRQMTVRKADVARGWGRYCSKRCKAVKQEARTGQYSRMQGEPAPILAADLAFGGYGDAQWNTPFGDGKW